MSQHDYDIANGTGAAFRADLNSVLAAIATLNSGAAAPAATFAGQWWHDTATATLKRRNAANTAWITIGPIDQPLLAATDAIPGIVELATNAETATGTDATRAVPPSALAFAAVYQGKHTIWIPVAAIAARTTNGAAAGSTELAINRNMLRSLDFDTATQEFAQFEIAMPKSWNEGTLTAQVLWTAASGSGGVVWALQAVATSDDDAMDVAFGTEQTMTDTLLAANDCHISPESAAITVGGSPAENDRVQLQIKRNVADASDTLAVDAKLLGVRLFYTTNARNDA